ncbi:MAG: DUF3575 domain-containing protein [Muribaculaceae bacterium]|nr:DUF3575 domain-containing protein [Muribaculaceae bacterium]
MIFFATASLRLFPVFNLGIRRCQRILTLLVLLLWGASEVDALDISLQTNALYWLTTTPNAGINVDFSDHWSAGASFGYNAFNFPGSDNNTTGINPKIHHWLLNLKGVYHLRSIEKGHLFSGNIFYGRYNAGGISWIRFLRSYRYEGSALGLGGTWGYRIPLGSRWSIDLNAGAAWAYLRYNKYPCGKCGARLKRNHRNVVVPQGGVTFSYSLDSHPNHRNIPKIAEDEDIKLDSALDSKDDSSTNSPLPISLPAPLPSSSLPSISNSSDSIFLSNSDSIPSLQRRHMDSVRLDTIRFIVSYPVDKFHVDTSFGNNQVEFLRLDSLLQEISSSDGIKRVRVVGYASPEYTAGHNLTLSRKRSTLVAEYLTKHYGLDACVYSVGEDWEGLIRILSNRVPNQSRDMKIVEIIRENSDIAQRKRLLINLDEGKKWRQLARSVWPLLRRTEIEIIGCFPQKIIAK